VPQKGTLRQSSKDGKGALKARKIDDFGPKMNLKRSLCDRSESGIQTSRISVLTLS